MSLASAPGKLLIAGEYAVLGGAPALVMAINRRARAAWGAPDTDITPLHLAIGETFGLQEHTLQTLVLDSSELYLHGQKLGLGSSAALSVAVAKLTGQSPVFEAALNLHKRFQSGLGSGFDVAAANYGGALLHTMAEQPKRVTLPADLVWQAFATGQQRSTVKAIDRWRRVKRTHALHEAAMRVAESADTGASQLIDAISAFHSRLLALDRHHSLGITNPTQTALESEAGKLADEFGASLVYKQSGAGGGDVGIALASDRKALNAFRRIAVQSGLEPLDLHIDMQGVTRD